MSWGRGVANNTAGALRMPSVAQFAEQREQKATLVTASSAVLKVVSLMTSDGSEVDVASPVAYVTGNASTTGAMGQSGGDVAASPILSALGRDGRAYVYTHDHPHFLLRVHARPPDAPGNRVPEGCLGVSEIQRIGNHVCVGEPYTWRLYNEWRSVPILADLTLEVRHRFPSRFASTSESSSSSSSPSNAVKLKASALAEACAKFLFGLVVTVNETFLITFEGTELVCRVVDVVPEDATDGEEGGHEGGDGEDDDALTLPDHFRGMVEAGTRVFLAVDLNTCAQTLALEGNVTKASAPLPKNIVKVTTSDDEFFPVKARLLRPCLALTSAVQAGRGVHARAAPSCAVGVDCCTFDRVLLFLEAHAMGRPFDVLPEHLDGMAQAAEALNLAPLRDLIATKRGAFESRVRQEPITLSEVKRRNANGRAARAKRAAQLTKAEKGGSGGEDNADALEVKEDKDDKLEQAPSEEGSEETLLLLDGMVLDVSRWLEEHPGGSSIIPTQALDRDCTVFFEIYHVSRQSFLYLKEFYIGELRAEDLSAAHSGEGETCSPGFLETLRAHTTWRLDLRNSAPHKSF